MAKRRDGRELLLFAGPSGTVFSLPLHRTIVMRPQPRTIKADVKIDLPRPRDALTHEFIECQRRLTDLIVRN